MTRIIKKSAFYQLLFILCVAIPYFDNFELTFGVWFLSALFTINKKYSVEFVKQISFYILILVIALLVSLFKDYAFYFIVRDISYLLKPILGLLIGYQLLKKIGENPFELLIKTGLLIAIYHLLLLLVSVFLFRAANINEIREYAGYFSDYEIYAITILIFQDKLGVNFSRKKTIIYLSIIGFSCFMYLARTNFIQFFILIFALKGFFKINVRSVFILTTLLLSAIIGYCSILYINPKRNGEGLESFLYKVKIAPIEPFKTRINRDDYKDLNDNYRSYENIMTIRQVSKEGRINILFGEGAGSKIDLKSEMMLNGVFLRYISILHNGFMTVFLKSGILGVILLLFSFKMYFKGSNSQLQIVQQIDLILLGTGLYLILSYWVFMGYYFKADTKSILIGFLICLRNHHLKKEKTSIN
jgi:hypothetical protein